MDYTSLDLVLRSAIFSLALSAAVMVLARSRRVAARTPATALCAFAIGGIAAFAVSSAPMAVRWFGPVALLFDAWCIATPAAIWILAQALFREDFRPGPAHWAVAGALTAVTLAADLGRFGLGVLGAYPQLAHALLLAGRGSALVLVLAAGHTAIAHWRADLLETRRRARGVFVTIIVAVFATLAASDFLFGPGGASAGWLALGHAALAAIAFALLQIAAGHAIDEVLGAAPRPGPAGLAIVACDHAGTSGAAPPVSRSRAISATLASRVTAEMETRKLWQREGLGIAELAAELHTQEHVLRRAINQHLGYRNFNDFLHDYRLKEAARRLASPADDVLPVLTIALDCGYGSIGPFNRAFKARFGVTPTQYRNLRRDAPEGTPGADTGLSQSRTQH